MRKQSTYFETYHIYNMGAGKMTVFRDTEDLEKFTSLVEHYAEKYSIIIYAYCFESYQYHMLTRPKRGNFSDISNFIKMTCSLYTRYFNEKSLSKYNKYRSGVIFGAKFASKPIHNREELIEAICNIHNKSKLPFEGNKHCSYDKYIEFTEGKLLDDTIKLDTSYLENTNILDFKDMHNGNIKKSKVIDVHQGEYYMSIGVFVNKEKKK